MVSERIFREEEEFESKVLREAARTMNFVWELAAAYRAPELVAFLRALAGGLEGRPPEPPKEGRAGE